MKKHRPTSPERSLSGPSLSAPPESPNRLGDGKGAAQGESSALVPVAARLHLLLGPVGAGKSTYGLELARVHRALRFTLDEWMSQLFQADRPATDRIPWYLERAERCRDLIGRLSQEALRCDTHVVLELGLLSKQEREAFFQRIDAARLAYTVYVLDAPRDVRRTRVQERNRTRGETFSMIVPPDIFELASDRWQPVEEHECIGRDVRFLHTGADE